MSQFINESQLEFDDISSQELRVYNYAHKENIYIKNPLRLSVTNDGHLVYDEKGICWDIPTGWQHITWRTKPGFPHFTPIR